MGSAEAQATGQAGRSREGERLRKGLTLAERRQRRRQAILDSARSVISAKGYAGSTVEDICRGAFVSTRDFYAEFTNRESVLLALGEELVQQIHLAMVEAHVDPGPDLIARRTRARVAGVVHVLVDDPRLAQVALIESVGISPATEALRRQTHHLIADWISALVKEDFEIEDADDPRGLLLSLAVVGGANELIADWVSQPPDGRCTIDELIDVIDRFLIRVLHHPPR